MDIDFERMRRERRERLRAGLRDAGVDGLVLLGVANQEYVGVRRPCSDAMRVHYEPAVVLLTADGELHAWTPHPEGLPPEIPAGHCHRELDLEFPEGVDALETGLRTLLGTKPRLAIDELTGPLFASIEGTKAGASWIDASPITQTARVCKTSDEVACLRRAQEINEKAIADVRAALRPGVRETELSALLLRRAFELGATANCVDPIWNLTPRSRGQQSPTLHGEVGFPVASSDRFLREGDLVLCDTGLIWEGYHSDFGATWICSDDPRPDPGLRACFRRWSELMARIYETIRPGCTSGDIVRAASALEPHYKLEQLYLAHGIGCDAAEPPFIGTDRALEVEDQTPLLPGMTIVFEPLIWEDGVGGYRSEEMLVITDDGYERLSSHDYAPFEVDEP